MNNGVKDVELERRGEFIVLHATSVAAVIVFERNFSRHVHTISKDAERQAVSFLAAELATVRRGLHVSLMRPWL
jgi:hypothetical protein